MSDGEQKSPVVGPGRQSKVAPDYIPTTSWIISVSISPLLIHLISADEKKNGNQTKVNSPLCVFSVQLLDLIPLLSYSWLGSNRISHRGWRSDLCVCDANPPEERGA